MLDLWYDDPVRDMEWILEIFIGGHRIRQAVLDQPSILIGRSPRCEIHLPTQVISRKHAKITIYENHVLLEDLGSTNSIYVRGEAVGSRELCRGDSFAINPYKFVLEQAEEVDDLQRVSRSFPVDERPEPVTGRIDDDVRQRFLKKIDIFEDTWIDEESGEE